MYLILCILQYAKWPTSVTDSYLIIKISLANAHKILRFQLNTFDLSDKYSEYLPLMGSRFHHDKSLKVKP